MGNRVLIVGGVAGGASAATRLRRLDEDAEIILFERGDHISFANCGLPYYIGGVIPKRERLLVQSIKGMRDRFRVDVRVRSEVTRIDRANKEIEVLDRETGRIYRERYDYLILSPGAEPVRPRSIPGAHGENVFTLRNVSDSDRIAAFVREKGAKNAVVAGGGFIGLEMAENLSYRGLRVSLVEMAAQVLEPLDREMAAFVHNHLRSKGLDLYLSDGVKAIEDDRKGGPMEVVLQSGTRLEADLVILAVGVKPEVTLAREAGLEIGELGGIKVDEYLRTSDPSIYAVGDAIEVVDFVTGTPALIPLAGPANKQGRIAAENISGGRVSYRGTQGTAIVKVFDLAVASTGKNEKSLRRSGIPYHASIIHASSHAGYYPGASPMTIKILFAPDGKLLGAQIVGSEGVDKRIDVISSAMRFGGTVWDLAELELAYAPPFGSAKDPVNMAGFVGGNIVRGDMNVIHWYDIDRIDRENAVILDVREPLERAMGMIEGSINIPLDQLRDRIGELPRDKEIIIYCQAGLRGYFAQRILNQRGFSKVKNLSGGYKVYEAVMEDLRTVEALRVAEEIAAANEPEEKM